MPIPNNLKDLTALFNKLGADDPDSWAKSQINEGIPQLLRFIFLKHAWDFVVSEEDFSWIQNEINNSRRYPGNPYSGIGIALEKCLEKGAKKSHLTEIARGLQAEMIFNIARIIDTPEIPLDSSLDDVEWGLFQVDKEGKPIGRKIHGLYESVLTFDPTGREMRPSKNI